MPLFVLAALMSARVTRFRVRLGTVESWVPLAAALVSTAAVTAPAWPISAAWHANLGAVAQARADLSPALEPTERGLTRHHARLSFERALAVDPDQITSLRRLAQLDVEEGRHAEAAGRLALAWARDPTNWTTRKAYGLALVWTTDIERAATLLAPVQGIVDELNAWASWRASQGEVDLAVAAARTSLRVLPSQPAVEAQLNQLLAMKASPAQKEVSSNSDFKRMESAPMRVPAHTMVPGGQQLADQNP
jgi:tetratricopeptide (TPR) repeat protein